MNRSDRPEFLDRLADQLARGEVVLERRQRRRRQLGATVAGVGLIAAVAGGSWALTRAEPTGRIDTAGPGESTAITPVTPPPSLPDSTGSTMTTTTTTSAATPAETVELELWFVTDGDVLEPVTRAYPDNPLINDVLRSLESPPTEEEQVAFMTRFPGGGLLTTEVLPNLDAVLQGTAEDNARGYRTIKVEPAADFRQQLENNAAQARLGVGQLVCTFLHLPGLEGVDGVELVDDRGALPLTDSAGRPIEGPATVDDFGC